MGSPVAGYYGPSRGVLEPPQAEEYDHAYIDRTHHQQRIDVDAELMGARSQKLGQVGPNAGP